MRKLSHFSTYDILVTFLKKKIHSSNFSHLKIKVLEKRPQNRSKMYKILEIFPDSPSFVHDMFGLFYSPEEKMEKV